MSEEIRVVSLNCWGLKFISKVRNERMTQIGVELAALTPPPSIVGLQECWTQEDYNTIRELTRHILPYGKFYFSGVFGGGLAILSKWPIEESSMIPYKLNGRPTAFFRGDWFVGKGVACAKVRISEETTAEVFCTHLHAPYEREPNDSYICHRTAQAWEISKLMRSAYEKGNLAIAVGDFNMIPQSLAHKLICTYGRVQDTWLSLHPDSSIGAAIDDVERTRGRPTPSANFNMTENGATCDSIMNTWRFSEEQMKALWKGNDVDINPEDEDPRAKRLDYVFLGDRSGEWSVESAKVGMTGRHPTLKCSLSDHFSVEVTLSHHPQSDSDNSARTDGIRSSKTKYAAAHLPLETYDEILAMTDKYILRERRQRRLRLGHFIAWVPVSIGCLIAVWWSPYNFVAFILMLLSTLGLSAGVIDGLIGGLFMSLELRALKEFRWEIENARGLAKTTT